VHVFDSTKFQEELMGRGKGKFFSFLDNPHVSEITDPHLAAFGAALMHLNIPRRRSGQPTQIKKTQPIVPSMKAAWVHEFADDASGIEACFVDGPGAAFDIDGPELDRDRIQLAAGFGTRYLERYLFSLNYLADFAGSDSHHNLAAMFRVEW
jgi:hypothetical protein